MHIITVASQKGGAGKTTVAFNLAIIAAQDGRAAAIIDQDPQRSAALLHGRRTASAPLLAVSESHELPAQIDQARAQGVDFLVIDTAPHNNPAAAAAARLSNLIVMPCRPGLPDLDAMRPTIELARVSGTPALVVFTHCPPARLTGPAPIVAEAAAALAGGPADIYDGQITFRAAINHANTACQGITEYEPSSKGADEFRRLYATIVERYFQ